MADKFILLSAQTGPLEGGGTYSSVWLQPLDWEDRGSPHFTRGPVPFKVDTSVDEVMALLKAPLPALVEVDLGIVVAAGNKSKGKVFKTKVLSAIPPVISPSPVK